MKNVFLLFSLIFCVNISFGQMTPTYDDIWITMRDGELLQADVFIPDGVTNGEVILIQTPYNKNFYSFGLPMGVGVGLDDQPFIWVVVDWRGFYGSSDADLSDFERGEDGYDICEWIIEQVWHGDRIGTWGPSALGSVQYMTAREHHPNHTCAVPLVATAHQSYDSYFYGGVLEEARLYQLDALGYGLSPLVLANPFENALWNFASSNSWYPEEIEIPTLQIGGWYDHNIDKMMTFYKDVRNLADADVQDEQWLLVGPWVHGGTGAATVGSSIQGELSYPNAEFKSDTMAWDFLNYYLLDADNGWDETDMITYYLTGGPNYWATSNEDDLTLADNSVLYLDNDGGLSAGIGSENTSFVSDPAFPSPTIGGATLSEDLEQGPYDQSSLDSRGDLITFTTGTLPSPVALIGRMKVTLYVSSDQPDVDIAIRLVDVYPDGRSMLITDGIKRMRFRNDEYGEGDQVFMEPGEVYAVEVDLPFTRYLWSTGHAIKIYVSGNNASRFNVNLQDGGEMYVEGEGNIANITIHHDAIYPSNVLIPGASFALELDDNKIFDFGIYPNPTNNVLQVKGADLDSYAVYDPLGNLVIGGDFSESSEILVQGLSKGVYILRIKSANGSTAERKFIKK